jgi:hypothetical protein
MQHLTRSCILDFKEMFLDIFHLQRQTSHRQKYIYGRWIGKALHDFLIVRSGSFGGKFAKCGAGVFQGGSKRLP